MLKRKMTGIGSFNGLAGLITGAAGDTGPSEAGGQAQPINIKVPIGTPGGKKKEKNNKKLLDIIKGYEEEKLKQHLSKDELNLMSVIDEFKPKEEDMLPAP